MYRYFQYFLILIIITSCNSWKEKLSKHGDNNLARRNAIIDFTYSNMEKKTNDKVFSVTEFDGPQNMYGHMIIREQIFYPSTNDTVGSYPKTYFPSKFHEENGKLFLWGFADRNGTITTELVSIMQKYEMIDSLYYKIQSGEISKDNQEYIITDASIKGTSYFMCKNDILNFKKVRQSKVLSKENFPNLNCSSK